MKRCKWKGLILALLVVTNIVCLREGVFASAVPNVTGFKVAGWATDALRLNWNVNTSAQGYIIEQKNGSKWTRIARLEGQKTKTYRVEKLKPATEYSFRIKAFTVNKGKASYSGYVNTSGMTNLANVSGFKIGGWAKDALRVNWNVNSGAQGYIIEQKNGNSWKRIARIEGNKTKTFRVEKLQPSTEYSFRIRAFSFYNKKAVYSGYVNVSGKTYPGSITNFKVAGWANNALRVNWDVNSSAEGYIIEQKDSNGSWKRIARLEGAKNKTFRVEKLKPGTEYSFRMCSFNLYNKKASYSGYVYATGKTNPAEISGLKIGGSAYNALRLNWNADASAQGYIVEQKVNGTWKRIARLEGKNLKTYRVEKLEPETKYEFRVKAFSIYKGKASYSNYKAISGKTLKYNAPDEDWELPIL